MAKKFKTVYEAEQAFVNKVESVVTKNPELIKEDKVGLVFEKGLLVVTENQISLNGVTIENANEFLVDAYDALKDRREIEKFTQLLATIS